MNSFVKRVVKSSLGRLGYEFRRVPRSNDPVLVCQERALAGREVSTILDVGANKGDTVEAYRRSWPNAKIHAFEPHPQMFGKLEERFLGIGNVKVSRQALGEVEGSLDLKISSSPSMHSIVGLADNPSPYVPKGVRYLDAVSVPVSTLDDYVVVSGIGHIDVLKINVEGFEKQVLIGAKESLGLGKIGLICIEVMFVEHFKRQWRFLDIFWYLESNDYRLFDIPMIRRAANGQARWGNAVFINTELAESLADRQMEMTKKSKRKLTAPPAETDRDAV